MPQKYEVRKNAAVIITPDPAPIYVQTRGKRGWTQSEGTATGKGVVVRRIAAAVQSKLPDADPARPALVVVQLEGQPEPVAVPADAVMSLKKYEEFTPDEPEEGAGGANGPDTGANGVGGAGAGVDA